MPRNDPAAVATVPVLDGRTPRLERSAGTFAHAIGAGPIALVWTGLVLTALWSAFLGWCVFGAVRWILA